MFSYLFARTKAEEGSHKDDDEAPPSENVENDPESRAEIEEILTESEAHPEATGPSLIISEAPTAPEAAEVNEASETDEVPPLNRVTFLDHHSLKAPSAQVDFQKSRFRIYEERSSQFILQVKDGDNQVLARKGKDGSVGLSALRIVYTTTCLLMAGFLLIFCIQILLFLFLNLADDFGFSTEDKDIGWGEALGTLFSVPMFVYSLACAMAIAAAFVADVWSGSVFLNQVTRWRDVSTQWFVFIMFLGIPLCVATVTLFARLDDWWTITALTWYSCVFSVYCIFAALVVCYEIMGTLEMIRRNPRTWCNQDDSLFTLVKKTILFRLVQELCGVEHQTVIMKGSKAPTISQHTLNEINDEITRRKGLYCRFTELKIMQKWGLFRPERTPVLLHSVDEVRDKAPFVTAETWSLEKMYCRNRSAKFVAVIGGPARVTEQQARSSVICAVFGNVITVLLLAAFLSWFELGAFAVSAVVIITILLLWTNIHQTKTIYTTWQRNAKKKDDDDVDEVIYQVWESFRITVPTPKLCWCLFFAQVGLFYVWPVIQLFVTKNYAMSTLFLIMGFISMVRFFFNAAEVLRDVGSIDILNESTIGRRDSHQQEVLDEDLREKSRIDLIVGKISSGPRRNVWIWIFAIVVFIFSGLFYSAYNESENEGNAKDPVGFMSAQDFVYKSQFELEYPTCRFGNGLEIPRSPGTGLADYIYLTSITYNQANVSQAWLDAWFGENAAIDNNRVVDTYRGGLPPNEDSAVLYRLFTFPVSLAKNVSIVSIRGTVTAWDALTDAQLWSAAALAQYLRALLPLGEIWTPILENLVYAVSIIESTRLNDVAYYTQTTRFVEYLKKDPEFKAPNELRITGHSLGGGLAMISGAQTGIPAISLSGPNNKLSRKTFDPPISEEALDTFTFNIVPDHDPVPQLDDFSRLIQRIDCTAAPNQFVNCHNTRRSLCEVLYKCGNVPAESESRPLLCDCYLDFPCGYGYPRPEKIGNTTFEEACRPFVEFRNKKDSSCSEYEIGGKSL